MRALLVVAVVLAALAGCAEGDPGAGGDVESLGDLVPGPVAEELTESGGCPDGVMWAADGSGSLAVTVEVLTAAEEAGLPSEDVVVTVVHGDALPSAVCDPGADGVAARSPAAHGRVEVERNADGCPDGFRIDGLEATDGTTFGPIVAGLSPTTC